MFKFHDCAESSKVSLVAALPGNPLLLILYWNAGQEQIFTVLHMLSFRMCESVCWFFFLLFYKVVANSVSKVLGAGVGRGIFHGIAQQFSHFLFSNLPANLWGSQNYFIEA